jgi:flagellin FlaA/flagellin FlaB
VESRVTEDSQPEEPPAAQDLEVVSTVGRVTDEATIGSVSSVVKLAAGSDAVDMAEVIVEWVGPSGTYDLQAESSAGGADGRFALSPIAGQTDSFPVLTEPRDRFQLVFDLGEPDRLEGSFGEEMPEGATAELRLVLPKDNSVREQLVVPSSLADRTAGAAVQL